MKKKTKKTKQPKKVDKGGVDAEDVVTVVDECGNCDAYLADKYICRRYPEYVTRRAPQWCREYKRGSMRMDQTCENCGKHFQTDIVHIVKGVSFGFGFCDDCKG